MAVPADFFRAVLRLDPPPICRPNPQQYQEEVGFLHECNLSNLTNDALSIPSSSHTVKPTNEEASIDAF